MVSGSYFVVPEGLTLARYAVAVRGIITEWGVVSVHFAAPGHCPGPRILMGKRWTGVHAAAASIEC
jgi:hypothetical protein